MPKKILILTVGGSCEPIVNAISKTSPDFVYFVCSSGSKGSRKVVDGKDKPCQEREKDGTVKTMPSIVDQAGLQAEKYEIIEIEDPDDFQMCYEKLLEVKSDIEKRFADESLSVIANYTGGTKTMSAALVAFSLLTDWDLQCNVGPRVDLIKVRSGDVPVPVSVAQVRIRQHLQIVSELLRGYHYGEAVEVLERLLTDSRYMPGEIRRELIKANNLCKGFNAWDLFDHREALSFLEHYGEFTGRWLAFLRKLIKAQDQEQGGYEEVEDLLLNAERRAVQMRFDDAVARLYRAVELLAQIRLKKQYQIDTSNVDLSKVPESVRTKLIPDDDGKVRIGQSWAYAILTAMDNEPMGEVYRKWEKRLKNALTKRNFSILAHGNVPIDKATYDEVSSTVCSFI
ncbi:MAG: TIGR02710 family CRISPR-associated CARF protein [Thermodesulforhabdaceae bacterium]